MNSKSNNAFIIVCSLFVTVLLLSNIIVQKFFQLGPFIFGGSVLLFPMTYILGDVLTEVRGYARSRIVIQVGFLANVVMSLVFALVIRIPSADGWQHQEAFESILGSVPRIVFASLMGYLCWSFLNSYVLAKLKLKHQGKKMWVRFFLSTIVGEGTDTLVFYTIAFYWVIPKEILLTAILSSFLFKVIYEMIALPISIPIARRIKRTTNHDHYDVNTNFNPFYFQ